MTSKSISYKANYCNAPSLAGILSASHLTQLNSHSLIAGVHDESHLNVTSRSWIACVHSESNLKKCYCDAIPLMAGVLSAPHLNS